jgi:hypothetical protein
LFAARIGHESDTAAHPDEDYQTETLIKPQRPAGRALQFAQRKRPDVAHLSWNAR